MPGRQKLSDPLASVPDMDLNAFWGLAESSGADATDQADRLERLRAAVADLPHERVPASRGGVHAWADEDWPDREGLDYVGAEAFDGDLEARPAVRGLLVAPEPPGQRWDFADPAEISARVPRLGALFGKVA